MFSPVVIFCYNRIDTLKATVKALQNNFLANSTDIYIFSEAPKTDQEVESVLKVRSFIKTVDGFKSRTIIEADKNKGLANSIIYGVEEVLEKHNKVIVLEDDLVVSQNFLNYMNSALDFYSSNSTVSSISAYTFPISLPKNYSYDNYFTLRASSWGWATWKDRWEAIDWDVKDYAEFLKDSNNQRAFNKMGSDLSSMLKRQMNGQINSWAIRWNYHHFKNNLFSVFPTLSKVQNIGFGTNATHTVQRVNRFHTKLDETTKTQFNFNPHPRLEEKFVKQLTAKYSVRQRLLYKLINFFT